MELIILVIIILAMSGAAGKKAGKKTVAEAKEKNDPEKFTRPIPRQVNVPPRAEKASSDQWAAAREKQADAEHLHARGSDSCEARLENLKILHNAGILDDVEYSQRVARVKRNHAKG